LVLLAEALQEQSRWEESVTYLKMIDISPCSGASDLAFVLMTRAHRWLGWVEVADFAQLPAKLLDFMESHADVSSRVRAAVEAASILDTLRSSGLTPRILKALSRMDDSTISLDDKANLLLAKSMLLYSVRDFDSSLSFIHAGTLLLESNRATSSILAMFYNGEGAILSRRGAYDRSIPAFLKSHEIAVRTGNDRMYLQTSGNLALSFARLGEYEKAASFAEPTFDVLGQLQYLNCHFTATQSAIRAYAMLGRIAKAQTLIDRWASQFTSFGSVQMQQAWGLYLADAYAIIGRMQEAEEVGQRAITSWCSGMDMDFCVGPYARWVARSSVRSKRIEMGHERLAALTANLEHYDAMDRAEILNATCWLMSRTGRVSDLPLREMNESLRSLPLPVTCQLRAMGMLDFSTVVRD
jgi:tetratricopeptide (TPR) repeat protein